MHELHALLDRLQALFDRDEPPPPQAADVVRSDAGWPCPYCGAERWQTLFVEDERGRGWAVDRCGCRY